MLDFSKTQTMLILHSHKEDPIYYTKQQSPNRDTCHLCDENASQDKAKWGVANGNE